MKNGQAEKPRLKNSEVFVTVLSRLLMQMRVWVIVGTILSICCVIYAVSWAMTKR